MKKKTQKYTYGKILSYFTEKKFTELVAKQCHKLIFHNDLRETLNQIRTEFWFTSDELLRSVSFAIIMKEIHLSIPHLHICHRTD